MRTWGSVATAHPLMCKYHCELTSQFTGTCQCFILINDNKKNWYPDNSLYLVNVYKSGVFFSFNNSTFKLNVPKSNNIGFYFVKWCLHGVWFISSTRPSTSSPKTYTTAEKIAIGSGYPRDVLGVTQIMLIVKSDRNNALCQASKKRKKRAVSLGANEIAIPQAALASIMSSPAM